MHGESMCIQAPLVYPRAGTLSVPARLAYQHAGTQSLSYQIMLVLPNLCRQYLLLHTFSFI